MQTATKLSDNKRRVTARFKDGAIISKRSSLGVHKFGWQVTWLNANNERERLNGFAYNEHSAQKCIARVRKAKLWGPVTGVTSEITWAIYEDANLAKRAKLAGIDKATRNELGKKRYLISLYPGEGVNSEWAQACAKGNKHLILAETSAFYTIEVLGNEYRVSKKTWTITGPWRDGPGFTINRRDKL